MRKIVTSMFVMSFLALEAALFYAGHLGLNLADMTAPQRAELQAKANMWYAAFNPAAYRDLNRHVPKQVEEAWQSFASIFTPPTGDTTADAPAQKSADKATARKSGTDVAALAPLSPSEASDAPRLDVSRLSPDGTSVFAGTARANETITLFADGQAIAEATADETGSWSITTEHRFVNLDPKLTLEAGQHLAKVDKPTKSAETHEEHQALAAREAADALKNFEAIVDAARRESAANGSSTGGDGASYPAQKPRDQIAATNTGPAAEAKTGTSANPSDSAKDGASTTAAKSEPQKTEGVKTSVVKIPVPITFVYNGAELTGEGAYAARLLLDYVKLKGLASVSLTGHADERGSRSYNYELSRERLETIAKLLRDGGYDGRLKLIPKGKSEPYRGIDRKALPREALYQADRRVELRYVR